MKKTALILLLWLGACAHTPKVSVTVENPVGTDRAEEMVEIPVGALSRVAPGEGETYVVSSADGSVVPSQVTHDGLLIFQSGLNGGRNATFTVTAGKPRQFPARSYGRFAEERFDDFIWENDRVAFRIYGKALAAVDGPSNGIDALYKRSGEMVLDRWYSDALERGVSYHDDHGTGLDDYKVGRTLGAGAMAPYVDGRLVLNENFQSCELLDNGPLRTTFRLFYKPLDINGKLCAETRTISIDAGSQMSKVVQEYGVESPVAVAAGFPIHAEGREPDYRSGRSWLLLEEPATAKSDGVCLGVLFPDGIDCVADDEYSVPEGQKGAGTYRHILALSKYLPETPFTYYTGFGWSQWGFPGRGDFELYLRQCAEALDNPLKIIIK